MHGRIPVLDRHMPGRQLKIRPSSPTYHLLRQRDPTPRENGLSTLAMDLGAISWLAIPGVLCQLSLPSFLSISPLCATQLCF